MKKLLLAFRNSKICKKFVRLMQKARSFRTQDKIVLMPCIVLIVVFYENFVDSFNANEISLFFDSSMLRFLTEYSSEYILFLFIYWFFFGFKQKSSDHWKQYQKSKDEDSIS